MHEHSVLLPHLFRKLSAHKGWWLSPKILIPSADPPEISRECFINIICSSEGNESRIRIPSANDETSKSDMNPNQYSTRPVPNLFQ